MPNIQTHTPPVIRVFLSSTFADMDHERSYFNEVLAPKINRICVERGVSFFNVDLRWGITEEDQIDGKVLPICLGEIDKCRPYFIGILGNRYGSVMERVPEHVAESIPWLSGKEGHSITELEMLYAVLDHEKKDTSDNSAFYIRSDSLSKKLYGNLVEEDEKALAHLNELKKIIIEDEEILHAEYDSIEEFGELVMRDLVNWLNENFPESGDVNAIRREWYNGEILRNHIPNTALHGFLDSYIEQSRKSLLFYGDGARGKTAFLTAWEPTVGSKILINCAADEIFSYWPSIAMMMVRKIRKIIPESEKFNLWEDESLAYHILDRIFDPKGEKKNFDRDFFLTSDNDREKFRLEFIKWLRKLKPTEQITVVINDLNLLDDVNSRLLSWLPAECPEGLNIICSTNDDEMVENADILGWNTKEMPLFDRENAEKLINDILRTYGKNLSSSQLSTLLDSVTVKYPGQLRFVISFLINHGRFNNLDRLVADIASSRETHEIYRYIYGFLTEDCDDFEKKVIRTVLGLLRLSNVALDEHACFVLAGRKNPMTTIIWARACRVFEQFEVIKGDYWYIRNEETAKFVDSLLTEDEFRELNVLLGAYMHYKIREENKTKLPLEQLRATVTYSKEAILHYRMGESWENLVYFLSDHSVLSSLIQLDWYAVRSAWVSLFLNSDIDVSERLLNIVEKYRGDENNMGIVLGVAGLLNDLELYPALDKAKEILGKKRISGTIGVNLIDYISDEFISIYNKVNNQKNAGKYRPMLELSDQFLASGRDFNNMELCQLLFFKADAEEHLGLWNELIHTANKYYNLSIAAGYPSEMQRALAMRGSALYRLGKLHEAMAIQKRVEKIALTDGDLRRYLSSQNSIALCLSRLSDYKEAIEIYDSLMVYWGKLGSRLELGNTVLNRCNALYRSDDIRGALESAESYYADILGDRSMIRMSTSLLGNMGLFASDLGEYEKAEEYLLAAIVQAKENGLESTLLNAYTTLTGLYKDTDRFMKAIDLYSEQMELYWSRRQYSSVIEIYKKAYNWIAASNHKVQARKFETFWKERFSALEGGLSYFEKNTEKEEIDAVAVEKLKEKIAIAKSEGDKKTEAIAYADLAVTFETTDPIKSAESSLKAAKLYREAECGDKSRNCVQYAILTLFDSGKLLDSALCKKILAFATDPVLEKITELWVKLGEAGVKKNKLFFLGKSKEEEDFYSILLGILEHIDTHEHLISFCINDLAKSVFNLCDADQLLALIDRFSDKHRERVEYALRTEILDDMHKDTSALMNDYLSPEAEKTLAYYEKAVVILDSFDPANAAAIAGNIALIFRRRKDKEKALRYHSLSIEAFRRAKNVKDTLIEMMNMATAYKEFCEIPKAIELLREGVAEAEKESNAQYRGMIAGNLASLLSTNGTDDDAEEIMRCFAIEEEYCRRAGYYRDIAISLMNQIIYLYKRTELSVWKPKLDEFGKIVRENNLKEFEHNLAQLEWIVAQHSKTETSESDDEIRGRIETILSSKGKYKISNFEIDSDGNYHATCEPAQNDITCAELIYIFIMPNSGCKISVYALYQPVVNMEKNLLSLKEYLEWWNNMGDYKLSLNESNSVIRVYCSLVASDWNKLCKRFDNFIDLWETDKTNILSLLMGVMELSVCQGIKLNGLHKD